MSPGDLALLILDGTNWAESYLPQLPDLRSLDWEALVEHLVDLERASTPAQWEILCLLAQGYSVAETARRLGRDESTVREHVRALRRVR